jgi:hypothetical protein
VFKVLLPVIFILINIGYWPTILQDYLQQDNGIMPHQPQN